MARRRVLVAPLRGGYKYLELTAAERERDYIRVRRKIRVGRAPARRRRFWIEKEVKWKWYEYTRYYSIDYRKGDKTMGYEIRVRRKVREGDRPETFMPPESEFDMASEVFPELKGVELRRPTDGIREVSGGPRGTRVARMGPGWRAFKWFHV